MSTTTVRLQGPLFTEMHRILTDCARDCEKEVALVGERLVRANLGASFKHPTGHYLGQVVTDLATDKATVTDGGVVYGPWLEGVSSRNQSTRFKGYNSFRRAYRETDKQAAGIAQKVVDHAVARLNR